MCSQQNIVTPANTVDHIVPITLDNIELFFDFGNLQSLCAACHRIKTNLDMGKISRIKDGIELKKQMESD
ncbi:MAG: HNH endonuclease signature motif containing protein [Prolixibacteraceae bacterium]